MGGLDQVILTLSVVISFVVLTRKVSHEKARLVALMTEIVRSSCSAGRGLILVAP